jgi:hypothetical protein
MDDAEQVLAEFDRDFDETLALTAMRVHAVRPFMDAEDRYWCQLVLGYERWFHLGRMLWVHGVERHR